MIEHNIIIIMKRDSDWKGINFLLLSFAQKSYSHMIF